jgi:hypothetical protein
VRSSKLNRNHASFLAFSFSISVFRARISRVSSFSLSLLISRLELLRGLFNDSRQLLSFWKARRPKFVSHQRDCRSSFLRYSLGSGRGGPTQQKESDENLTTVRLSMLRSNWSAKIKCRPKRNGDSDNYFLTQGVKRRRVRTGFVVPGGSRRDPCISSDVAVARCMLLLTTFLRRMPPYVVRNRHVQSPSFSCHSFQTPSRSSFMIVLL